MAELRRDPLSGNWAVVGYTKVKKGDINICPFCPGNEGLTPHAIREFRDPEGTWLVRCFPAASPVFVIEVSRRSAGELAAAWAAWGEGASDSQPDSKPAGTGENRPGEEKC